MVLPVDVVTKICMVDSEKIWSGGTDSCGRAPSNEFVWQRGSTSESDSRTKRLQGTVEQSWVEKKAAMHSEKESGSSEVLYCL